MQDYKMLVRAVWALPTNPSASAYNFDEVLAYLNDVYLANGYKVLSVDFLGEKVVDSANPDLPKANQYVWHLVKEVSTKKES